MANFTFTPGTDIFDGITGEDNQVSGAPQDLDNTDIVNGSQQVGDTDTLRFTAPGSVDTSETSVRYFERLFLDVGDISLTLDNAFVASANSNTFFIFGSEGGDTIDASSVTSPAPQIRVLLRGGNDTYIGSASDETFTFSNGQLTSADTIDGGAGSDMLLLAAGTSISASDLANVTGIESVTFRADGSITVMDSFVSGTSFKFLSSNENSASDQTIDASGVSASAVVSAGLIYKTMGGSDTIMGSAGRDNFFFDIGKGELDSSDVVQGGDGFDTLLIQNTSGAGATVSRSAFANVSGIELVNIASASPVTVELADISNGATLRVVASDGNHTIDTTVLTADTQVVFGAGDSTLVDGAARTRAYIAADELTSADNFDGGAGFDTLLLTTNGSVAAADLANVTNFEHLLFRRGGTVEINDNFAQGKNFTITGSADVEVVDGSAETSTQFRFRLVGAGDDLTGGAANDRFEIDSTTFAAIDGGGGAVNRIYTNSGVSSVDLTDPVLASSIENIQVLDLSGAAVTAKVDAAAIAAINGMGQSLYIVGQSNDTLTVDGEWEEVGLVANAAVAPSVVFREYSHSSGVTLYVANNLNTDIDLNLNEAPSDIALDALTLDENVAGDVVGAITVTDADPDDTFTFAVNDARFEVVGDAVAGFQLQLKATEQVDREAEGTIPVQVTVTDSGGLSRVETFVLSVNDADDNVTTAPVDADAVQANAVNENASAGTYTGLTASATDADATSGAITYAITGGTGAALFSVDASGAVRVAGALDFETAASYTLEIQATPANGAPSTTQEFTIAINDVNDTAPVLDATTGTVAENARTPFTLSATDTDTTGEAASFSINAGSDGALFEIVNGNQLRLIDGQDFENPQDANTDNVLDVDITVSDGTNTRVQTVSITVTDVNEAPVAEDATAAAIEEGATVTGSVTATDVDVDTTLTYTLDLDAAVAGLTLNGDGSYSFDPDDAAYNTLGEGETLEVVATFTASDGSLSDSGTLTITVTGTNDAPVASAAVDLGTVAEDGTIVFTAAELLANATDVDAGDVLSVSNVALANAGGGTLTANANGTYSFAPAADFNGDVTFTFDISDDSGAGNATIASSATLAVTPVNDAPVAADDTNAVTEPADGTRATEGQITGNVLTNDVAGPADEQTGGANAQTLSATAASLAGAYGDLELLADGSYTYTLTGAAEALAEGEIAIETFSYTMSDGDLSDTATLTITVTGTNDSPVATGELASTDEDMATTFAVLGNDTDADGDTLTVTAVTDGMSGTAVVNADNTITYTPNADFDGNDTVTYTIDDGNGGTTTAVVILTINAVNDAPVTVADSLAATENGVVEAGNVLANDSDVESDGITVTTFSANGATAAAGGSITLSNGAVLSVAADGAVSLTQNGAFETLSLGQTANVAFSYVATDGTDAAAPQASMIVVSGANDSPTANNDFALIDLETATGPLALDLLANDSDIDNLDIVGSNVLYSEIAGTAVTAGTPATIVLPGQGQLVFDGTNVTFEPGADFDDLADGQIELVTFSYQISDGASAAGTASVTIAVIGDNSAPVLDLDTTDAALEPTDTSYIAAEDDEAVEAATSVDYTDPATTDAETAGRDINAGAGNISDLDGTGDTVSELRASVAEVTDTNGTGGARGVIDLTNAGWTLVGALGLVVTDGLGNPVGQSDGGAETLVVSAGLDGNITQAQANNVLNQMHYVNTETTFALDTGDREVTVTVTDVGGLTASATATIPVIANVTDTDGVGSFAGTRFNDVITGVAGGMGMSNDLQGLGGNDTIQGSSVADIITGGTGDDDLKGGDGDDQFNYSDGDGDDVVDGQGGANDQINITASDEDDTVTVDTTGASAGTVTLDDGSTITFSNTEKLSINGGDGDDTFEINDLGDVAFEIDGDQDGANGGDTLDLSGESDDVTASLGGDDPVGSFGLTAGGLTGSVTEVENLITGAGNDALTGSDAVNTLQGGDGADTLDGAAGSDVLYGGTETADDASIDTAQGYAPGSTIAYDATNSVWTVTSGMDVDTLYGIEKVVIGAGMDAQTFLLVDQSMTQGAFGTISEAITASHDGDTVLVAPGVYDENITIPTAITVQAASDGAGGTSDVTLKGVVVQDSALDASTDTVALVDLKVTSTTGSNASGIRFQDDTASGAPAAVGTLVIDGVTVTGFAAAGLGVNAGSGATDALTMITLVVTDSDFIDNGANGAPESGDNNGANGIDVINFGGDATFTNVNVSHSDTQDAAGFNDLGLPPYGIQFAGFHGSRASASAIDTAIGTVAFENVSVTGDYDNGVVYIHGFTDFAGLDFTGGLTIGDANTTSGGAGLRIQAASGGSFVGMSDGGTAGDQANIDVTGVTSGGGTYSNFGLGSTAAIFVNGSPLDDTIEGSDLATGAPTEILFGGAGDDVINGNGGVDLIFGDAGDDVIDGGAGDDGLVNIVGQGKDSFQGGDGDDTLVNLHAGSVAGVTTVKTRIAEDTVNGGVDVESSIIPTMAPPSVFERDDVDGVENIVVAFGEGGDTLTLSGDLAAAGIDTVTVDSALIGPLSLNGGGDDTVDASGLTGASAPVISATTGKGDDTFIVNTNAADNVFAAGEGDETDGDTLDYSSFTTAATVDLGAGTADGFASVSDVENVIGGAAGDDLTGDAGANTLSGGGGFDTLTGGGGDDALDGGEVETYTAATGEGDVASYGAPLAASDITANGTDGGWQVVAGTEGTDELDGIEIIEDGLGNRFLLVGEGGFASVQDAVDEAVDGDVVLIAAGSYAENVTVGAGITLKSAGGVVSIGSVIVADAAIDMAGDTVTIDGISIDADLTGAAYGISFADADGDAAGTLNVIDSTVSNAERGLTTSSATGLTDITVNLTNTAFIGNGEGNDAGGSDINLFNFAGDATFTDVSIDAGYINDDPTPVVVAAPHHSIQIAGFTGDAAANSTVDTAIGTVVFDGVEITGSAGKSMVFIHAYNDLSGLSFNTDGAGDSDTTADGLTLNGASGWPGVFINADSVSNPDPMVQGGTFVPAGTPGSLSVEGITVIGTNYGDFGTGIEGGIFVVGTPDADTITGSDNALADGSVGELDEIFFGLGGNDSIDGGDGIDAVQLTGTASGYTIAFDSVAGTLTVTDTDNTAMTVNAFNDGIDTLSNVEVIRFADGTQALIVDSDAQFGSFTTIAAAIAVAGEGDTIFVVGRAADYAENLTISEGISLVGIDVGDGKPTIAPASNGPAITLAGTFTAGETVSIDNIDLDGATAGDYGIRAATATGLEQVTLSNMTVTNFDQNGISFNGNGVAAVSLTTVTAQNNGTGGQGGSGEVQFFQYNGNVTVDGLTLSNDGPNADTALQFRSDTGALGTVSLKDVTVSGAYDNQPVAFFNYDNVDGLSVDDLEVTATSRFATSINFDGIGGNIDLTNTDAMSGATFTDVTTVEPISLQGEANAATAAGVNELTGGAQADFIRAYGGDDVLQGNGGDDIILGFDRTGTADENATDNDTAVFAGDFAEYTLTTTIPTGTAIGGTGTFNIGVGNIPGFQITDTVAERDGTDLVGQVENLQFADGIVRVVGAGGYNTIDEAIDAANDGDTIWIANGTYGAAVIDKEVTLVGESEAGVIIQGADVQGSTGLEITADNVTLKTLTVSDFQYGIHVTADIANLTIDQVSSVDHVQYNSGGALIESAGLWTTFGSSVEGLMITDSHFDGSTYGMYFQNSNPGFPGTENLAVVNNVSITGTSFNNNALKAVYAENLNNATFDDVEVINSGHLNSIPSNSFFAALNAGFDFNLKFGAYKNIAVTNSLFQDSGRYFQNSGANDLSGALQIKARDDGGTYGPNPATLNGLTITGNTIETTGTILPDGTEGMGGTRTEVAIRLGETNADNAAITGVVTISGNTIDSIDTAFADETAGSVDLAVIGTGNTVIGTANDVDRTGLSELGANLIVGADAVDNTLSGGNDDDRILGGSGNDTITGGMDSDTLFGGAGDDVFIWNSGDGSDTVAGGADSDVLEMTGSTGAEVDWVVTDTTVTDGTGTVTYSELENIDIDLLGGNDVISVENVTGLPILDIDGGDNVDTISFADYAATAGSDAIDINLAVVGPTANSFTQIGSGVVHSVFNVENVVGSDGDDIIGGSALDNVLSGGAGDDLIEAQGGADVLEGGAGEDSLFGGAGNDTLYGGAGEDVLNGGAGADQFLFNTLSEGGDLINGFVVGADQFAINASDVTFDNLVAGPLVATQLVVSDIAGTTYSGGEFGDATFVLDTTLAFGERNTLYFDNDGDGNVDGVIAEFDASSNLSGFSVNDFFIFDLS